MTSQMRRRTARPVTAMEAQGATIQAAIAQALARLGVRRDQVTVQVLAEEKKGLFGMRGAAQAKVRVALKSSSSREPPSRRPSNPSTEGGRKRPPCTSTSEGTT